MMKTMYIYSLSDPVTEEVKYVGKTVDPLNRFWGHIHEAKRRKKGKNEKKAEWIRELLSNGLRPKLNIIEEIPTEIWEEKEIYWIAEFIKKGHNLLNVTKGGKCGVISQKCREALSHCTTRGHKKGEFHHTEETKIKIRAKRALQVMTFKHKESISKTSPYNIKIKEITENNEEIIWNSITDAAKFHKVATGTILCYLRNTFKTQKIKSKFYHLNT